MQSVGPYRFTHMLGTCPVGKAWAAIDEQGRFVTVAVLDAVAASTPGWREAFAGTANAMSQRPGGQAFAYADFFATEPWAAYPAEVGAGAEKLFRALGQEYQAVPTEKDGSTDPVAEIPRQVSGPPHPVSGVPQPVSGLPHPVPVRRCRSPVRRCRRPARRSRRGRCTPAGCPPCRPRRPRNPSTTHPSRPRRYLRLPRIRPLRPVQRPRPAHQAVRPAAAAYRTLGRVDRTRAGGGRERRCGHLGDGQR
ncbi:hypothetical protein GCM10027614_63090 [Micromonospora vulcania]